MVCQDAWQQGAFLIGVEVVEAVEPVELGQQGLKGGVGGGENRERPVAA